MREIKRDIPKESLKSLDCSSLTLVLAVYGLAGVGFKTIKMIVMEYSKLKNIYFNILQPI